MRKAQKELIEDTAGILGRIHGQIEMAIKKKDNITVRELLAQCRNAAARLGEIVEEIEGEQVETVALLARYCEWIGGIMEETGKKGAAIWDGGWDFGIWQRRMENSIRQMKLRREAVFLPYKASMWDSLESVWKAADEDPDCDAYVIPIPYYDRNPDQTLGTIHCEGDLFPSCVPITNYEAFDFEAHRPDMIFIHNPYDQCNIVTSVHPFFYSDNLKKYTEKLVYIPYFILKEIEPEDKNSMEEMKGFCLTPGVLGADQVIVQSEQMRQVYIKILTEASGNTKNVRSYWEKKILGLGSPKLDKVFTTREEDISVPGEWDKVIRKADGSVKRIVLYNNGITSLLKNGEEALAKMKSVFEVFREHKDHIALLWRPHPLMETTLTSMRPHLWEAYREIRDGYRKESWGIYDESGELDRAVVVSDAYYGDPSSVVSLFEELGKPVMIQNVKVE